MSSRNKQGQVRRRPNKPQIEKKRRVRINKSLAELKTIILENMKKENINSLSKLEKADILELTVQQLRKLELLSCSVEKVVDAKVNNFQAGFQQCIREVTRHSSSVNNAGHFLYKRLVHHLNRYVQNLSEQVVTGLQRLRNNEIIVEELEANLQSKRQKCCEESNSRLQSDVWNVLDKLHSPNLKSQDSNTYSTHTTRSSRELDLLLYETSNNLYTLDCDNLTIPLTSQQRNGFHEPSTMKLSLPTTGEKVESLFSLEQGQTSNLSSFQPFQMKKIPYSLEHSQTSSLSLPEPFQTKGILHSLEHDKTSSLSSLEPFETKNISYLPEHGQTSSLSSFEPFQTKDIWYLSKYGQTSSPCLPMPYQSVGKMIRNQSINYSTKFSQSSCENPYIIISTLQRHTNGQCGNYTDKESVGFIAEHQHLLIKDNTTASDQVWRPWS
ncbi:uncharacterized protein LOC143251519 [Tachypleus tridentatus]|uniref:uncharacterized protein LOC143251519 n=1 Tax=Tachypleus tridentatus TaxID=6853 RepID=UPI003FD3DE56